MGTRRSTPPSLPATGQYSILRASLMDTGGDDMSGKHWLAAYGERIPAEIDAQAYGSVVEMLEDAMQLHAEKPAFRCFGQTLTYADTDRLSRAFAAYLQHELKSGKGDRIAVMLP